ncbi:MULTISPECIES: ATP-dependent DNA helicase RecG [Thermus]|jgi:ATP-dependent DNA helicase RecG|uniref:ATP-dependent DNA helicase RecG n=1 Tax=Thermus brockianus TaxID=56956 RepID=A0A1J0LUF7_THEBO|nr:ATP-dependent DNA helicase RecG [Thermus brockianus]APD10041.1 ATP-dependent DNA helicase RecG [Thermus brockianus]BDG16646.1 ATP-dependent DNA helicase RecG [Thermus brockianus]
MGSVREGELKERLLRPLLRELKDGARDRVVVGGLESLVENLARPFPEVRRLFQGYGAKTPEARKGVLEAAIRLLQDGLPPEKPQSPPPPRLALEDPAHHLAPPQSRKKLSELGLHTVRDVLQYYPRRYEDRRTLPGVRFLEDGKKATLQVKVLSKELIKTPKKGMQVVQVKAQDAWGWRLTLVWFNQPWVLSQVEEGATLIVTGRVQRRGGVQLFVEHFEDEGTESLSTGRIVPIYPAKEGISQAFLRRTVHRALELALPLQDPLGPYREAEGLADYSEALTHIHFPEDEEALKRALLRLKFDEYLLLELKALLDAGGLVLGRSFRVEEAWVETFKKALPFPLTRAQARVMEEIAKDMQSPRQMARLLQGDVGSGKTVVAAFALFLAAQNGAQGALMAPTEILARQHFQNLTRYLFPLGVRVELLLGSMSPKEKEAAIGRLAAGEAQVAVGTHALIQEGVAFRDLGLAVVDEEHRFGVLQRRALLKMAQVPPDVLVMSATPIPRSLALTLYGDLEVSVLDEMPPGRTPVKTKVLPHRLRLQAYAFAREEVKKGHQVFVVAPAIEENEELDLKAAKSLYEELKALLPEVRMALLHGKLPAREKEAVMEAFRQGSFDLLVSTTVIEVGVDIPKATLIIVENAERFGLAQLHQLRGRVGRGGLEGYALFIAGEASGKTLKRLKVLEESTDGFYIAEMDLKLRGPGELRGTRQSGYPELRLGDLAEDTGIIERARALAKRILEADPDLSRPEHQALKAELRAQAERIGFREVI